MLPVMGGANPSLDYQALANQYSERAERGDAVAQNNLGALYLRGRGVEQNNGQARRWFEKSVEGGLPAAMFNLGVIYLRGYGVKPDINKANELITSGALQGDRDAQFFLGLHHYHGRGFERDIDSARLWFRRAAEQGVVAAMYNLGILYLDPDIGDEKLALTWLEKAALKDYPDAKIAVAKMHLSHSEDPLRVALGLEQITHLAESNNLDAQIHLGMMFTFGQGVEQNYDEGRFWLERAASQGASQAQLNLGNLFAEGLGVEKHLPKAYAWYSIGADNGDVAAARNVEILKNQLNEDALKQAEQEITALWQRFGDELRATVE